MADRDQQDRIKDEPRKKPMPDMDPAGMDPESDNDEDLDAAADTDDTDAADGTVEDERRRGHPESDRRQRASQPDSRRR